MDEIEIKYSEYVKKLINQFLVTELSEKRQKAGTRRQKTITKTEDKTTRYNLAEIHELTNHLAAR